MIMLTGLEVFIVECLCLVIIAALNEFLKLG
jgi:hypothetical protein